MHDNGDHSKYLDSVKHPAKKGRANQEILAELGELDEPKEENFGSKTELTEANVLSQRII